MSQSSILGTFLTPRKETNQSGNGPLISLIMKFSQINKSASIDNKDHLRIFETTVNKFKDDPNTQLRNIENKSQMNRADVELLVQRKPKIYSLKSKRYNNPQNNKLKYLNIYKQYQKQLKKNQKIDTDLTSQDDFLQTNTNNQPGIKHYSQLKNHPKLLQYTLNRLKNKNIQMVTQKIKQQQKRIFRDKSRPDALYQNQQYRSVIQQSRNQLVDKLSSPQIIVQNQLTKFYSRSNKSKIDPRLRDNPRCNKFLQRHEKIILGEQNRLSKENMKKLKTKLNVIVNQIEKDDRKSLQRLKQQLPRLSSNRYTFEDSRTSFNTGSYTQKH